MATRTHLRTKRIRATTDELAQALADARYGEAKIVKDRRYSNERKAERLTEIREDLDATIAEIERSGDKAHQRAKEDTQPAGLPKSPGAALLVESQKARAWNQHVKPLLDAGRDPTAIATRLVKKGDRLALQTLAENLPFYLETEAQTEGEASSGDKRQENYMGAVRESLKELRTPEEEVADEAFAEVDRAHKLMQTNLGIVRRDREGIEPAVDLWRDNSVDPVVLADL